MAEDKIITTLRRRLEKWELKHLRAHALELQERIDEATARAENAEADARHAWQSAEQWQENAMAMMSELAEITGGDPGITQDGQIGIVARTQDGDTAPVDAEGFALLTGDGPAADLLDAAQAMRNYLLCRSDYDVQAGLDGERWETLNRAVNAMELQS